MASLTAVVRRDYGWRVWFAALVFAFPAASHVLAAEPAPTVVRLDPAADMRSPELVLVPGDATARIAGMGASEISVFSPFLLGVDGQITALLKELEDRGTLRSGRGFDHPMAGVCGRRVEVLLRLAAADGCEGHEEECAGLVAVLEACEEWSRNPPGVSTRATDVENVATTQGRTIRSASASAVPDTVLTAEAAPLTTERGVSIEGAILGGLTDFIVSRAKAETVNWLAADFASRLCAQGDEDNYEVATFFPRTCALLGNHGERRLEDIDVSDLDSVFRDTLRTDLDDVLPSIVTWAGRWPAKGWQREAVNGAVRILRSASGSAVVDLNCDSQPDDEASMCRSAQRLLGVVAAARLRASEFEVADKKALEEVAKSICDAYPLDRRYANDPRVRRIAWLVIGFDRTGNAAGSGGLEVLRALTQLNTGSDKPTWVDEIVSPSNQRAIALIVAGHRLLAAVDRGDNPLAALQTFLDTVPDFGVPSPPGQGQDEGSGGDAGAEMLLRLRFMGLALRAISSLEPGWQDVDLGDPAQVDDLVVRAVTQLQKEVDEVKDPWFKAWCRERLDGDHVEQTISQIRVVLSASRRVADRFKELRAAAGNPAAQQQIALQLERDIVLAVTTLVGNVDGERGVSRAVQAINLLSAAWIARRDGDYGAMVARLFELSDALASHSPIPPSLARYRPILLAFVSAKSPQDVTAALETYAVPVGGWRFAHDARRTVSLSAMLGLTAGGERLEEAGWAGHAAPFVPVGFQVTWGVDLDSAEASGGESRRRSRRGMFFPLLDVGALASARIQGGEAALPDDAGFEQVFAPGIFYFQSIRRSPFLWGGGVSAVPELRTGGDGKPAGVIRATVFVSVDVAVFHLNRKQ